MSMTESQISFQGRIQINILYYLEEEKRQSREKREKYQRMNGDINVSKVHLS